MAIADLQVPIREMESISNVESIVRLNDVAKGSLGFSKTENNNSVLCH